MIKNSPVLIHRLINSITLRPSKREVQKDLDGEIIGLEKVHESKEWHKWVYGGERNPKT